MKRSLINQLNQLSEQLKGYVAALNYRYLNLCVKAEEVSLLPVQVAIEGEVKNLEDVAYAGKKGGDDYSLFIVPKYEEDLQPISEAVMHFHPEFIQKVEKETVKPGDGSGSQEIPLLKLTVPEVNDDRYDVLKQGTKTFYDMCKADMEAAGIETESQLAVLGLEEKPEDMDNLKKAIDEVSDIWKKKRDELYDEKLKEIEEAHDKWKAEQAGKMEKEQKAANENRVATSMRLTPDNDEQ